MLTKKKKKILLVVVAVGKHQNYVYVRLLRQGHDVPIVVAGDG